MTLRQSYEYALSEANKLKAPSILLEDFIYFFNKAIQQYANMVYNRAEYNQQSSDDIGVLQTIAEIECKSEPMVKFEDTIWKLELPKDYVHILNCLAEFKGTDSKSHCGKAVKTIVSPCQRLTADLYSGIKNNYYMKPSHTKPYYQIINRNTKEETPTNPEMDEEIKEGSYSPEFIGVNEYRFYALKSEEKSRVVNQATVNIEIHSGASMWELKKILVTYIKAPMYVSMTQDQLLAVEDTTPKLEFPDYVCYEIINLYMKLFLENVGEPRLQTHLAVNKSIAEPQ